MSRKMMTAVALAAPFVFAAGSANALDVGEKGSYSSIMNKLASEGQTVIADSILTGKDRFMGLLYTKNAAGSVGYVIVTNKPVEAKPDTAEVHIRLTNVQDFDPRLNGVPAAAKIKTPANETAALCDALAKRKEVARDDCMNLNAALEAANSHNNGVILQGDGVAKQPDGSYKSDGIKWTFTAKMREQSPDTTRRGNALQTMMPGGATIIDQQLFPQYTRFTPEWIKLVSARGNMASLNLKP